MAKSPDDKKTVRLLRLVQLFLSSAPRRWRAEELAEALQTNVRNLYRDITDVTPLINLIQENSLYWVESGENALARLNLTESELRSLTLTTKSSQDPALPRLFLRRLLDKLSSTVDKGIVAEFERHLPKHPKDDPISDYYALLSSAVTQGLRLEMGYHSLNSPEPSTRRVDPYTLFPSRGVWYFSAFDHRSNTIRTFRIGRILSLTDTGERFLPSPEQGATDYLSSSTDPLLVRLRVCPLTARLLHETPIHPSQQLEQDHVTLHVGQPNLLIPCLLSLPDVEVLEPLALRQALAEKAEAIARRHR